MERSAHIVANLFAQVVCLSHLHTKSWIAVPVDARPISAQGVRESPSNGGAMIATNFAFRSMKEFSMTLRTQSSAVNVMYYLQHAGCTQLCSGKMVQKPLTFQAFHTTRKGDAALLGHKIFELKQSLTY